MTHSGTHLLTKCGVLEDSCYLNTGKRAWHAVKGLAVQWLMALRTIEHTFAFCQAECLLPPGPTVELAQTLAGKWRSLDFSPVSFLRLHPLCGHVPALALRAVFIRVMLIKFNFPRPCVIRVELGIMGTPLAEGRAVMRASENAWVLPG